jgi:hypothetical protein
MLFYNLTNYKIAITLNFTYPAYSSCTILPAILLGNEMCRVYFPVSCSI